MAGSAPAAAGSEAAMLQRLRASFALPYLAGGAAAAAATAGGEVQHDSEQLPAACQGEAQPVSASAAAVRAAADALRTAAAAEAVCEARAASEAAAPSSEAHALPQLGQFDQRAAFGEDEDEADGTGGFIPLSHMPGAHKGGGKPYKKRRRAEQEAQAAAEAAAAAVQAAARERKLFREVGLDDAGRDDSSGSDMEDAEATAAPNTAAAGSGQQVAAAADGGVGDGDRAPQEAGGQRVRGRDGEQLIARGRGGRGRGRGGRQGARGAALAAAAASLAAVRRGRGGGAVSNPFEIKDEDMIKGGKRSATAPRSGNRTATFR